MGKISIVMCTYNGETYLREQIDSLLIQTQPFYELIIQDDCSTDNTCHIIEEYRHAHPNRNIRLYINTERKGYNRNFLTAFQRAEGDYIAICDQDDVWMPHKLETMTMNMDGSPLAFSNSMMIMDGKAIGLINKKPLTSEISPLAATLYPRAYGHEMIFDKHVQERLRPYAQYDINYDTLVCTIGSSLGNIRYIEKPLVYWRRYQGATTFSGKHANPSKWDGYKKAIAALRNKDNRERTRRYFKLISQTDFRSPTVKEAVKNMSKGSLIGILATGVLCCRHYKDFTNAKTESSGLIRHLRAFFMPMFFIRDHGRYIVSLK